MKHIKTNINDYLNEQVSNNNTYIVYHGTDGDFDTFDYSKIGTNTDASWNGVGFYFSDTKAEASLYGNKIITAKIALNNPIDLTSINDSNIQGYGLLKFISNLKGFENIEYKGRKITEIVNIIDNLIADFDFKNVYFTEGSKERFKHVFYENEDTDEEYVLRNKVESEIEDKDWLKSALIKRMLYEKYDIKTLPIRINELMNPYIFTKIAKENGYDGVIAENSTTMSGNEYVVFDRENIKIL